MEYNWYILYTAAGSERTVKSMILEISAKQGLSNLFQEILIPEIEKSEIKKGKNVIVGHKMMPGYILIKMVMNQESWSLVHSIPKVSKFLDDNNKNKKPAIVPESEIRRIIEQVHKKAENYNKSIEFSVGDSIIVQEGPFESFSGIIEDVEPEKLRLTVLVSIFGRNTPIELSFQQVKKC